MQITWNFTFLICKYEGIGIKSLNILRRKFLAEFSSQLPHDGGAFYTTDTMESARPYYAESWAPILYAATLWLNAREFKMNESDNFDSKDSDGTNNNTTSSGIKSSITESSNNVERFHLLFGMIRNIDENLVLLE